jgi:hypothetical protein
MNFFKVSLNYDNQTNNQQINNNGVKAPTKYNTMETKRIVVEVNEDLKKKFIKRVKGNNLTMRHVLLNFITEYAEKGK